MDNTTLLYRVVLSYRISLLSPITEKDKFFKDQIEKCFNYLDSGGEISKFWVDSNADILFRAVKSYHGLLDSEIKDAILDGNKFEADELQNIRLKLIDYENYLEKQLQ